MQVRAVANPPITNKNELRADHGSKRRTRGHLGVPWMRPLPSAPVRSRGPGSSPASGSLLGGGVCVALGPSPHAWVRLLCLRLR